MTSTLSDEESDGSQEEDNMVNNQVSFFGLLFSDNRVLVQGCTGFVAIDVVCNSAKPKTVATESKTTTNNLYGSDSESRDESENDNESLQEAYENMYTQWLNVYATNCALDSKNQELRILKEMAESKVQQLKALVAEKD